MHTTRTTLAAVSITLALALTACGDADEKTTDSASDPGSSATSAAPITEAQSVTIDDPWVKSADSGMTAAFGTLVNSGPEDVVVVSATSEITTAMELHETVENADGGMAMQPKEGGFTIPAGGEHELSPGGDHLMIMDLTRPLAPGESIIILLTMADGSTTEIDATVKPFTGADEEYQDGEGMDMDGSESPMDSPETSEGSGKS